MRRLINERRLSACCYHCFIRPQRSRHWISRAWCRRLRRYRAGDGPQHRPPSGRRSGSDNADGADGRAPTFSGAAVRRMVRARPSHRNVTSTPTLRRKVAARPAGQRGHAARSANSCSFAAFPRLARQGRPEVRFPSTLSAWSYSGIRRVAVRARWPAGRQKKDGKHVRCKKLPVLPVPVIEIARRVRTTLDGLTPIV
jgi:hypothetical protein